MNAQCSKTTMQTEDTDKGLINQRSVATEIEVFHLRWVHCEILRSNKLRLIVSATGIAGRNRESVKEVEHKNNEQLHPC